MQVSAGVSPSFNRAGPAHLLFSLSSCLLAFLASSSRGPVNCPPYLMPDMRHQALGTCRYEGEEKTVRL